MRNWSRHIEWHPSTVAYPSTEEEIQNLVIKAANDGKQVRMIGTGHSFNPLWVTDSILISLDNYQGLVHVDEGTKLATVKGGTKLNLLGDLLHEHGLAMENLGDIDAQSIAGTISTGTHGTGLAFGTISTQVRAIKFINGKGEVVACSESKNPSLFKAAQVSLGMLGVIIEVTLQCVPSYKLKLANKSEPWQEVISTLSDRQKDNRNFEFYFFPYTDKVWTKSSNKADGQPDKSNIFNHLTEYVVENYAFKILCESARFFPSLNQTVSKISAGAIPDISKVQHSHKVYATKRLVRFNEMEYNVPIELQTAVLTDIKKMIGRKKFNVHFPIEVRSVKADDIYISPAQGRDSAYIACHVYSKKEYRPYFAALEEIFKSYGGRPHWGKKHTLLYADVQERYSLLDEFEKHRKDQDPEDIFMNDYLKSVFAA